MVLYEYPQYVLNHRSKLLDVAIPMNGLLQQRLTIEMYNVDETET